MKDKVDIFSQILTDTDSFIYDINKRFYEMMHEHKEFFDLSNYHRNSKYFCIVNKKVLGKMKDEYVEKLFMKLLH